MKLLTHYVQAKRYQWGDRRVWRYRAKTRKRRHSSILYLSRSLGHLPVKLITHYFQAKCDQYWPSEGTEEFGDIELRLEREDTLAFYTLRTFSLRSKITLTAGKKTKVSKWFYFYVYLGLNGIDFFDSLYLNSWYILKYHIHHDLKIINFLVIMKRNQTSFNPFCGIQIKLFQFNFSTLQVERVHRTVYQYHYTAWPDHGVPLHALPLITFVRNSAAANPDNGGPILVHCR